MTICTICERDHGQRDKKSSQLDSSVAFSSNKVAELLFCTRGGFIDFHFSKYSRQNAWYATSIEVVCFESSSVATFAYDLSFCTRNHFCLHLKTFSARASPPLSSPHASLTANHSFVPSLSIPSFSSNDPVHLALPVVPAMPSNTLTVSLAAIEAAIQPMSPVNATLAQTLAHTPLATVPHAPLSESLDIPTTAVNKFAPVLPMNSSSTPSASSLSVAIASMSFSSAPILRVSILQNPRS